MTDSLPAAAGGRGAATADNATTTCAAAPDSGTFGTANRDNSTAAGAAEPGAGNGTRSGQPGPGWPARQAAERRTRSGPPRRWWPRRAWSRSPLLGYGVPVAAAALLPAAWFSPGAFVAAGDVPPFEWARAGVPVFSMWNHDLVGTGSPSYEVCRLGLVVLSWSVQWLGFSPAVAQHVFYALLSAFAAFGGAYLAAVWIRQAAAVAVAGLMAACNAYLMVNVPLPLPALAIGLCGTLAGMVLRAGAGRRVPGAAVAAASLPASYLAVNPPLLSLVGIGVLGAALLAGPLTAPGGTGRAARLVASAAPWALLLHLWWLVPYVHTLTGRAGLSLEPSTDLGDWAWTQARATLANVLALNTHWGWPESRYFPYRPAMEDLGSPVLRWALPLLAALGLLLVDRRRRRAAWVLAGVCASAVVLSVGQPPLGTASRWVLDAVPGGWLLRNPSMKLAVFQVLAYAALAAFAVDRLCRGWPVRRVRLGARTAAVMLVVGALAHPWPMWTGAVVPGERADGLPAARVTVPADWYRIATIVDAHPRPGKVLVLPLIGFYQATTTWGYHGTDLVPDLLIHRPVLRPLPEGYFSAAGSADAIAAGVQDALLRRDRRAALRGLRALGAGQLLVRHDLADGPYRPTADAAEVRAGAEALLPRVAQLSVASLYDVPGVAGVVTAAATVAALAGGETPERWRALSHLPADPTAEGGSGVATGDVIWRPGGDPDFVLPAAGRYHPAVTDDQPAWLVEVRRHGRRATLRLAGSTTVVVDGRQLRAHRTARRALAAGTVAVAANGRLHSVLDDGNRFAVVGVGGLRQYSASDPLRLGPVRRDRRCRLSIPPGHRAPAAGRLEAVGDRPVRRSCLTAALPDRPGAPGMLVEFEHRQRGGAKPRLCLAQRDTPGCGELPQPRAGEGWRRYRAVAAVDPRGGPASLHLYAGGRGPRVDVRGLRVRAVLPGARVPLSGSRPSTGTLSLGEGRHAVAVRQAVPPALLRPTGPVGNCHNTTGLPAARRGIRADLATDGAVRLTAAADVACLILSGDAPVDVALRLHLRHRTLAGRPARVCLWQVGPQRCAPLPDLARSAKWDTLSAIVRPEPGTRALHLYLYADGQARPRTVVEFRDATLTPVQAAGLRLRRAAPPPAPPDLTMVSERPGGYRVRVEGAGGPFALVLAEAAAPGWRLGGLPAGWRAERFKADGYANGWLVTGHGDARLDLFYAPNRYAAAAVAVSCAGLAALLAGVAWRSARRLRSVTRRRTGRGPRRAARAGRNPTRPLVR